MNIFFQFGRWYWVERPKKILNGWRNLLRFGPRYFSLGLLFKTFFAPWRNYTWNYGRGFDLGRWLEVFFSNLLTRLIGAFVRTLFILLGLFSEVVIFGAGFLTLAFWYALPLLLVFLFFI